MKKYFLTGLVLLMPVALTLLIIFFLFNFFTGPFVPLVSTLIATFETRFDFHLPPSLAIFVSQILALILLCLFIVLLGILTRWLIIKNILEWGHRMISKIPFIKSIYKVSSDIFNALFSSDGKKAFKYPVIIPFAYSPSFSLGFQAGEVAEEIKQKVQEPLVSVFMPTAPHPLSGFLFFTPKKDAHTIKMTNEEAVKFLVSCGMVCPESNIKRQDDDPLR